MTISVYTRETCPRYYFNVVKVEELWNGFRVYLDNGFYKDFNKDWWWEEEKMIQITNKSFYKRYKNFSGSFLEWFRTCVNENDVFRFWYREDDDDAEADYVQIISVADIGGDFLLGLKFVAWNGEEEGEEMVGFKRLSEVRAIEIFADEEVE